MIEPRWFYPAYRLLRNRFPISPAHPPIAAQSFSQGTRRSAGQRGATFSEVMVAVALISVGIVGTMGAFEAADKTLGRDALAVRALAMAESRIEAKSALPWDVLLFDDLDHDGIAETTMRDDGTSGDRTAGDGIYSAVMEQQGVKVVWTVAAHHPGPFVTAGAVVIEARGFYVAGGSMREIRLATLRANPAFGGTH